MFQTDHHDAWVDALLDFRPKNTEMRCTACLDTRSGIIVVHGSREHLTIFEEAFDELHAIVMMRKVNLEEASPVTQVPRRQGADDDEEQEEDEVGAIIVAIVREFRYRGAAGRRQRAEERMQNKEM